MEDFRNKVAVVTGAASGIGHAIAERCVREGMKVVLSDVEEEALDKARQEMEAAGADVLIQKTDVAKEDEVAALAASTFEHFGATHLLFNNAGVGVGGLIWDATLADWQWVLGVNLWGVIHGVRHFVPRMIEQDEEGHIVNTSSLAGLLTPPLQGVYNVCKHGVVALSETLHHELTMRETKLKVSVLCPGFVSTRIMDCERNRPEDLKNDPSEVKKHPEYEAYVEGYRQMLESGMEPGGVADLVFAAIREEKFYIHTHEEFKELIRNRTEDILQGTGPRVPRPIE